MPTPADISDIGVKVPSWVAPTRLPVAKAASITRQPSKPAAAPARSGKIATAPEGVRHLSFKSFEYLV